MLRLTRSFAVLVLILTVLGMLAAPTLAAPGGNSTASAACAGEGYRNYTRKDGSTFKNEGQCTKYEAQGNTLVLDPKARCRQEVIAAGIDPAGFNIITGTETNGNTEFLTPTAADLICGFGGEDVVDNLDAGDVFLGGDDNDGVNHMYGGTFNGGAGDDVVLLKLGGTFIQ